MAKKRKKKSPLEKATEAFQDGLDARNNAVEQVTAFDEAVAGASIPGGPLTMAAAPDIVGAAPSPTGATGVSAFGPGAIPQPEEERGFLAAFWPALVALGAGLLAFFWLDWSWWASGLAFVATLILARFGAAFAAARAAGEGA